MTEDQGCVNRARCPIFPKLKTSLAFWRHSFCDKPKHVECARFRLSSQGIAPPLTLLPSGTHLASLAEDTTDTVATAHVQLP